MERKKIGEVFHFFGKIGVAAIRLTEGSIAVGDTVVIQGPTTNLEQPVDALQIEHVSVTDANQGQEVGMKVRERVREKDFVYKLVESKGPAKSAAPSRPAPSRPAAAAPVRKVPLKPKPARRPKATRKPRKPKGAPNRKPTRKRKTPVRKASRARRSKARRGSRRSRSR